jgi:hypothetical protein
MDITNSQLLMNKNTSIIVEQGGQLIIDYTKLTNDANCGSGFWQGIQVLGTPTEDHIPLIGGDQGYLIVENGTKIENAEIGILAFEGGVIKLRDSVIFKNNHTAVRFKDYPNFNSHSYIRDCIFETTSQGSSSVFINLSNVYGVDIKGNSFINQVPDLLKVCGIYSSDAGFMVSDFNSQPNTFVGLEKGIECMSTGSLYHITIDNNEFTNNFYDIYLSGIDNAQISRNEFSVKITGLSLLYCTGYCVEENTFTGTKNQGKGIWVYKSGTGDNEIYKNIFSDLNQACLATGENVGTKPPITGLHFLCNEYYNNNYPIYITTPGIDPFQGSQFLCAGNEFYNSNNYDIYNTGNGIYYYYDRANPATKPFPTYRVTIRTGEENTCPSHFGTGTPIETRTVMLGEINNEVITLENQRQIIVDGGNTTQLESDIETSFPDEAYELRNKLLSESPYLSDTILATTTQAELSLPPVMLKQVLLANPHSAVSDKVWKALEERNIPLPDYMLWAIAENESVISAMEIIDGNLSKKKNKRERTLNSIINYYQNDTLSTANENLISVLNMDNSLHNRYKLISLHTGKKQTVQANELYNSLSSDFELNDIEFQNYTQYGRLIDIQTNLIEESKSYYEMTQVEKDELYILAEDFQSLAGEYSRNILRLVDNAEFTYLDGEGGFKNSTVYQAPSENFAQKTQFTIHPNPAKEYIIVSFKIDLVENINGQLIISDNLGRSIYSEAINTPENQILIKTGEFIEGTYYCRLIINGASLYNKKIIVKK